MTHSVIVCVRVFVGVCVCVCVCTTSLGGGLLHCLRESLGGVGVLPDCLWAGERRHIDSFCRVIHGKRDTNIESN